MWEGLLHQNGVLRLQPPPLLGWSLPPIPQYIVQPQGKGAQLGRITRRDSLFPQANLLPSIEIAP